MIGKIYKYPVLWLERAFPEWGYLTLYRFLRCKFLSEGVQHLVNKSLNKNNFIAKKNNPFPPTIFTHLKVPQL